jgi:hypothetical protein
VKEDRGVTDQRSPLDAVLDVVLYGPLGLVLTVTEELPKLAARGRSEVGGRVAVARAIGGFAVSRVRSKLEQGFAPQASQAGPAAGGLAGPADEEPGSGPPAGYAGEENGGGEGVTSSAQPAAVIAAVASAPTLTSPVEPRPSAGGLAIPGYDSLSASQVVQRLAGLTGEELDAVRSYELATRGRRTILARISQLQTG